MKKALFFSMFSLLLAATSANAQESQAAKIITEYFANVDAGNVDAAVALLTDDFAATAPFSPVPFDKMGWRGVGQGFKIAFPDMKHEIVDWFADGNKVCVQGIFKGTNTGVNMGNPPTGNRVSQSFTTNFLLDGKGKIKSLSVIFDQKLFESQLLAGINLNAAAENTCREMLAAADAGDAEKMLSYFAADSKHYFSGVQNTNDELKKRVAAFKMGFPDVHRDLTVLASANGVVTLKGWLVGTNTGSFMGKPATGNKIKVSALGVYKIGADGKITEGWVEMDSAALMSQLNSNSTTGSVAPAKN